MIIDDDFDENVNEINPEELKEFVHSNEFKESLEKAANKKLEILTDFKPEMNSVKADFIEYMLEGCGNLEKDDRREMKKKFGKAFKKLVDFQHYNGGYPKENSPAKLETLAENVEIAVKYFDFIKNPIFRDYLKERGIYIDDTKTVKLESEFPDINPESWENLKSIIDDGDNCQTNICSNSDHIKETIFTENVPEDLQYSKENKCGLKPSAFNKLAMIRAMKKNESDEKMKRYVTNATENSIFSIAREELLQEGIEEAK